jgi:hypothetical protein
VTAKGLAGIEIDGNDNLETIDKNGDQSVNQDSGIEL